jgi:hypothetical protein
MTPHLLLLDYSMDSICDHNENEKCFVAKQAPVGPSLPSQVIFWLDHVQSFDA